MPSSEPGGPPPAGPTPPARSAFFGYVLRILVKDLQLEWRSREIVYTMALFSALLVLIFSFAFAEQGEPLRTVAVGIVWAALAFSGTLGLSRFFEREREGDTLRALLISPAPAAAVYLAKVLGISCFMLISEAVTLPLVMVLFELQLGQGGMLVALLLSGTLGFAAVGSLFAAGLLRARSRGVLLGLLTYPVVVPVIVAGTKGTAALAATPPDPTAAWLWLKLLLVFDTVFVVLSLWSFGPLTTGE